MPRIAQDTPYVIDARQRASITQHTRIYIGLSVFKEYYTQA